MCESLSDSPTFLLTIMSAPPRMCKYGLQCTRADCHFAHPSGRAQQEPGMAKTQCVCAGVVFSVCVKGDHLNTPTAFARHRQSIVWGGGWQGLAACRERDRLVQCCGVGASFCGSGGAAVHSLTPPPPLTHTCPCLVALVLSPLSLPLFLSTSRHFLIPAGPPQPKPHCRDGFHCTRIGE